MTDLLRLTYAITCSDSATALALAKERARKDGYAIKGVSRVDFVSSGEWRVTLTVQRKEVASDTTAG